jgi:hypothetical protein
VTSFGEWAFALLGLHLISSAFEFFTDFDFVEASAEFTETVSIKTMKRETKALAKIASL